MKIPFKPITIEDKELITSFIYPHNYRNCDYSFGVAQDAKKHFGDRIDVVEYMYNTPENISRIKKMGVKQLPSLYLNGELKYSSLIPNLDDLIRQIEEAL